MFGAFAGARQRSVFWSFLASAVLALMAVNIATDGYMIGLRPRCKSSCRCSRHGPPPAAWIAEWSRLIDASKKASEVCDYKNAEAMARKAMAFCQDKKDNSFELSRSENRLAGALDQQHRYVEAEIFWRKSIDLQQSISPNYSGLTDELFSLATNLYQQGRYTESKRYYLQALPRIRRCERPDDNTILACRNLSDIYLSEHDLCAAEPLAEDALYVAKSFFQDRDEEQVAQAQHNLAKVYCTEGKHKEAIALYEKCMPVLIRLNTDNKTAAITNTGMCYGHLNKFSQALKCMDEARRLHSATCQFKDGHEQYIDVCTAEIKRAQKNDLAHSHH